MQFVNARLNPDRRRKLWAALLLAPLLCVSSVPPARGFQIAGLQGSTASEQVGEMLQKRVREFYSLLQVRQITQAERYTTEESRERLRDQASNPFLGFRIISTAVNPDGRSGTAVVELTVLAEFAPGPIPIQRTSKWEMVDGEWRVIVPAPPAMDSQATLGVGGQQDPPPEELKFEGHSFGLGVMKPGEVKEARFPFENISDHVVKIKEIATDCECLVDKTEKREYQPGEKGEVVIAFDSTNFEYAYAQTVVVTTSPGDVKSNLRIGAQVVPRNIAFPPQKAPETPQE